MNQVPTKQEMFNRAYLGLKSQGFQPAREGGACCYITDTGLRCAWGWVDPQGTTEELGDGRIKERLMGTIETLRHDHIGLAKDLKDPTDFNFAMALQAAHDGGASFKGPKVIDTYCGLDEYERFTDFSNQSRPQAEQIEANLRRVAEVYGLTVPTGEG